MKRLEELIFSHETRKWACPSFTKDVNPLKIDGRELDPW